MLRKVDAKSLLLRDACSLRPRGPYYVAKVFPPFISMRNSSDTSFMTKSGTAADPGQRFALFFSEIPSMLLLFFRQSKTKVSWLCMFINFFQVWQRMAPRFTWWSNSVVKLATWLFLLTCRVLFLGGLLRSLVWKMKTKLWRRQQVCDTEMVLPYSILVRCHFNTSMSKLWSEDWNRKLNCILKKLAVHYLLFEFLP